MIEQFKDFAEAQGLPLDDVEVIPDGQWHSFTDPAKDDSNQNGRYILSDDPLWSGAIGTHSGGWTCASWKPEGSSEQLSHSQRIEIQQKRELQRSAKEEQYLKAAKKARNLYESSVKASPTHPYLISKGVKPTGIRQLRDDLLIPIYDQQQQIQTLQIISPDGSKKLFPGGKKKGGFFVVGDWTSNLKLYVAEGWATAASVNELTGEPCACVVDCGNLDPAIAAIKGWLSPSWEICIAADNDWETDGNPGLAKAAEAAIKYKTTLWYPPFTDEDKGLSDWNDWYLKYHHKRVNND
jgi:putative DNA primase/helicase